MAGGKLISTGVEFPDATTQTTSGLPLTGGTMTGDVSLGDGVKATFGASDDLQIYHDGSNSYVDEQGTGILKLRGSAGIALEKYDSTEQMLTAYHDDAVTLFHNGSSKLATTSTGIDVTGSVTCDGFTSTGIDDNATSTAITIDSAEHVSLAHGIGFNGDTAAANALDDYEEGTFTPTYSLGFTGITYSAQQGRYTKTGDVVNYTIALTMSAATASANHVRISGLPFTSDATDGYGGAYLSYSPFIDAATVSRFVMHTPVNDTRVLFYTNTSQLLGTDAGIAPTGALLIMGSYFAA